MVCLTDPRQFSAPEGRRTIAPGANPGYRPESTTAPWKGGANLRWEAGTELFEYVCQQANYAHTLMLGVQESIDRTRFWYIDSVRKGRMGAISLISVTRTS